MFIKILYDSVYILFKVIETFYLFSFEDFLFTQFSRYWLIDYH